MNRNDVMGTGIDRYLRVGSNGDAVVECFPPAPIICAECNGPIIDPYLTVVESKKYRANDRVHWDCYDNEEWKWMPKFRKKPVVIEARQLIPDTDNWKDVCDWMNRAEPRPDFGHYGDGAVRITTLEGTMQADPGDWIIRGVQGEFYPCKPDIFEATYELVTED